MKSNLPDFDLDRYLPYRLTVIAAQLSARLSKQYKTQFGISIAEWRILLNLGYSGSGSVRDIEKRVSLEKSKVSRGVSRLEAKGYLTKSVDDKDRRLLKLALTETGVALLGELIPIATAYQEQLDEILGEKTQSLQSALDRLAESPD
ncbi:DNA-binding MarR family transcriptional regulator [Litoreibacter meonggei]|uniref:DNA-binding MarR family transcriptional regulator n=1 Tax=Litoreibacter meonggei TaxID=1049199 RepID=A0A497W712_9RHOB|nr:MarR family winged helix-turn-helix transcriptional regulator [Litoreibacter meonggei]RLJ51980.1 DNA-binding MarR family transcriptional regulator [Litoreibacter meonggei]